MLTKLGFADFRGYAGAHEIRLSPITLLYGHNSAGKSSIIKLLQLIAESTAEVRHGALRLDGKAFPALDARRLQSVYSSKNRIGINLQFQKEDGSRTESEYEVLTDQPYPAVYQLSLRDEGNHWQLADVDGTGNFSINLGEKVIGKRRIKFRGLHPFYEPQSEQQSIESLLLEHKQLLATLQENTVRLAADRVGFPSEFSFSESTLGDFGSGVPSLLVADEEHQLLMQELNQWFNQAYAADLKLTSFATPNGKRYSLYIEKLGGGKRVLVSDTGQGIAQVLPVLVACTMPRWQEYKDGLLLLIEHPELHLHASLHHHVMAKVIQSFGGQRGNPRHCVVLETHSESMLLETQIAILEKRLAPEDVTLVWVTEAPSGGATLNQTALDSSGLPVSPSFPIEAFMAQAALAQRAFDLRLRNADHS